MELWFTTSVGTGVPAHVLDIFLFGCPTDGASLNSLSSSSLLPVLLASDSVSLSYDGKYPINNIISFLFYIITNFSLLNSCCLLL